MQTNILQFVRKLFDIEIKSTIIIIYIDVSYIQLNTGGKKI